jgi:hypothetical protein
MRWRKWFRQRDVWRWHFGWRSGAACFRGLARNTGRDRGLILFVLDDETTNFERGTLVPYRDYIGRVDRGGSGFGQDSARVDRDDSE